MIQLSDALIEISITAHCNITDIGNTTFPSPKYFHDSLVAMMTESSEEAKFTNARHSKLVVMLARASIVTRIGMTMATFVLTRASGVAQATMTQKATGIWWPNTDTLSLTMTGAGVTCVL